MAKVFEVLGWLAIMGFGLWALVAGMFFSWFSHAMSGRLERGPALILLVGLGVLTFALYHAPFTITIGGR